MLKKILFPSQEENEKIILFLRRHWFILFKIIFLYFLLLFFPIITFFIFQKFLPLTLENLLTGDLYPLLILAVSLFYLLVWQCFFHKWLDYYLDIYIVTDKRIVDVEQIGLFKRVIAEQKLFRVQDVTTEVKGILPTFLHYGNVSIQTAGTKERFLFKEVPHPYSVSKKILELVEVNKSSTNS